jgi:hypothetical protein
MSQPSLTPALQRLLDERDRSAALAAEATAHAWPEAAHLEQRQHDLEEQLEDHLPVSTWRRLFPRWTLETVVRSHDPAHPAPRHCRTCDRAASANQRQPA